MSIPARAQKAIRMIIAGRTNLRSFDTIFEQGDGHLVVTHIINKIRVNDGWRRAVAAWHGNDLINGMPAAWVNTFNTYGPQILL